MRKYLERSTQNNQSMNRSELIRRLRDDHTSFISFVDSLTDEQLSRSKPNKWSASRQAQHVYLCLRPIRLALGLPKWIPVLLFGKSKTGSRSYESLVTAYQAKLQAGGKAPFLYEPGKATFSKERDLKRLQTLVAKLTERIALLEDSEMDSILLPHPLLGKLTIRELLHFALYHVGHHHKQAMEQIE
jgi:hypothetical protein